METVKFLEPEVLNVINSWNFPVYCSPNFFGNLIWTKRIAFVGYLDDLVLFLSKSHFWLKSNTRFVVYEGNTYCIEKDSNLSLLFLTSLSIYSSRSCWWSYWLWLVPNFLKVFGHVFQTFWKDVLFSEFR